MRAFTPAYGAEVHGAKVLSSAPRIALLGGHHAPTAARASIMVRITGLARFNTPLNNYLWLGWGKEIHSIFFILGYLVAPIIRF